MDLILWRHAEAEVLREGSDDLARSLTPKGERQAARMATWLDGHLPEGTRILCSPARRAEQTVLALGRRYKLREELAPNAQLDEVLRLIRWDLPEGMSAVRWNRELDEAQARVAALLRSLKDDEQIFTISVLEAQALLDTPKKARGGKWAKGQRKR